ncbi:MAG: hypothetical protein WC876_04500 [Candidatus Thermoplasmatota archaeon]|jgi:hypothetical protein
MAHRLTLADVTPAVPLLRDGRGWTAAVAAINALRPGAPPASERTIRRVLVAHQALEAFPPALARRGGRPRKPNVSDAEFKLAVECIGATVGSSVGMKAAATAVSELRIGDEADPVEVRRLRVSSTWLERQLRARGWTPAPRPELQLLEATT